MPHFSDLYFKKIMKKNKNFSSTFQLCATVSVCFYFHFSISTFISSLMFHKCISLPSALLITVMDNHKQKQHFVPWDFHRLLYTWGLDQLWKCHGTVLSSLWVVYTTVSHIVILLPQQIVCMYVGVGVWVGVWHIKYSTFFSASFFFYRDLWAFPNHGLTPHLFV